VSIQLDEDLYRNVMKRVLLPLEGSGGT